MRFFSTIIQNEIRRAEENITIRERLQKQLVSQKRLRDRVKVGMQSIQTSRITRATSWIPFKIEHQSMIEKQLIFSYRSYPLQLSCVHQQSTVCGGGPPIPVGSHFGGHDELRFLKRKKHKWQTKYNILLLKSLTTQEKMNSQRIAFHPQKSFLETR